MNIIAVLSLLLFVPVASGSLTIDWSVDPLIDHAIKVTRDSLVGSFPHTVFVTSRDSDLNLDPFFRYFPSASTVIVIPWDSLDDLLEMTAENWQTIKVKLVVLIMEPGLQVSR
jgi:hypothetical protein